MDSPYISLTCYRDDSLFYNGQKDIAENQLVKATMLFQQTLKEEEQTEKDLTTLSNELLANAGK
jgi:hypothetical protein